MPDKGQTTKTHIKARSLLKRGNIIVWSYFDQAAKQSLYEVKYWQPFKNENLSHFQEILAADS